MTRQYPGYVPEYHCPQNRATSTESVKTGPMSFKNKARVAAAVFGMMAISYTFDHLDDAEAPSLSPRDQAVQDERARERVREERNNERFRREQKASIDRFAGR